MPTSVCTNCFLQTYNVDFQVPDSAGTATAFMSGVKTNMGVVGVNEEVQFGDCDAVTDRTIVKSILRRSLDHGSHISSPSRFSF